MDAIDLKKAVLEKMDGLPMPQRLNGFQIFFFEPSRGIRQYSTGLPNCKFRDNLKLLIDEVIQQCDRSEPKLREKDIDKLMLVGVNSLTYSLSKLKKLVREWSRSTPKEPHSIAQTA
jgi:hypothetical protein